VCSTVPSHAPDVPAEMRILNLLFIFLALSHFKFDASILPYFLWVAVRKVLAEAPNFKSESSHVPVDS